MRVERFRGVSRPTVKKRAPWAKVIVRVDTVLIAYESQEEAMEEHGPVSNMLTRAAYGDTETRRRAAEKRK